MMPLSDIAGDLLTDSQDIAAVLASIGRSDWIADATAVVVQADDGDYDAVWVSDAARPYVFTALFERLV